MAISVKGLTDLRNRVDAIRSTAFREEVIKNCGAASLKLVADEFRHSTDPYGNAWKPLVSRRGKPLLDTGRLRASFAVQSTGNGFRIGTPVAYAGYHQFGTRPRHVAARIAKQNSRGRFVSRTDRRNVNSKTFAGTATRGGYLVRLREHQNSGITARPMLPDATLPMSWETAFERVVRRAARRQILRQSEAA